MAGDRGPVRLRKRERKRPTSVGALASWDSAASIAALLERRTAQAGQVPNPGEVVGAAGDEVGVVRREGGAVDALGSVDGRKGAEGLAVDEAPDLDSAVL